MLFLSEIIKTDVSVVKLLDSYILVGSGNFLSVYHQRKENHLVCRVKIFDGRKIHGIEVDDCRENIFLHGGCYMSKLAYSSDSAQFNDVCLNEVASDWILTAKWLGSNKIAVVLMLNKLIIYNEQLVKQKEIICEDKCMLYSACLYYKASEELVVFSGTVFGEILIWKVSQHEAASSSPVLIKLKGHKGVIFSVGYNANSGNISSSSDDRSTIIWAVDNKSVCKELQQFLPRISLKYKLHGHYSRVFRSMIVNGLVITAGEDSCINVWSLDNGQLLRKIETHQGSPVWTLDCNENVIVSGGGDCGVLYTPLHLHQNDHHMSVLPDNQVPKRLGILHSNSLVAITEDGSFYHLAHRTETWKKICKHNDLRSYSLLEVSSCKRLVSLAGYHGELYLYREQKDSIESICSYRTIRGSRIYSFHWLSCDTFFTCEKDGLLVLWYLQKGTVYSICTFILPKMKDVWTTAACQAENGRYVVGDRKGNIYVYALSNTKPIQIFKRVHKYLGVTKIYNFGDKIISIGRNAIVQTFIFSCRKLLTVSSDKVPFTWLCGMVDRFLLAFSGNNFLVWDYEKRRTVFQHNCGGGHRSWDFNKTGDLTIFSYIKDQTINVVEYQETEMCPINITAGYHTKTINSIEIFQTYPDNYVILSGSEDTNLCLCLIRKGSFSVLKNLKSHLSSIRTLCSYAISKKEHLVFSAGGREQIICWRISLEPATYNKNMCSEEHSYYEKSTDEMSSETRIMDLKVLEFQNRLLLLAATSEGNINIFSITMNDGKHKIRFMKKLTYKLKCITKICVIKNVLISLSTDGNMTFWDISHVLTKDLIDPFKVINVHQSGINSYSYKVIEEDLFVFLTGGDDNTIKLNLFQLVKNESVEVTTIATFQDCRSHCAQITGAFICDDYFFTTSVDQRLMVFKWRMYEEKLICRFLSRYDSAVADIQGLQCRENMEHFDIFLYGKGIEYVKCIKNQS